MSWWDNDYTRAAGAGAVAGSFVPGVGTVLGAGAGLLGAAGKNLMGGGGGGDNSYEVDPGAFSMSGGEQELIAALQAQQQGQTTAEQAGQAMLSSQGQRMAGQQQRQAAGATSANRALAQRQAGEQTAQGQAQMAGQVMPGMMMAASQERMAQQSMLADLLAQEQMRQMALEKLRMGQALSLEELRLTQRQQDIGVVGDVVSASGAVVGAAV